MIWMVALALAADPVLLAQQRAATLVEAGDAEAALDALRPLFERYDQETRLALQVGWLALELEDHGLAERAFARAVDLSGGSMDARLGLGWTLFHTGRFDEARAQLEALEGVDDERVGELAAALDATAAEDRVTAELLGFLGAPGQAIALGGGGSVGWTRTGSRVAGGLKAVGMGWVPRSQAVNGGTSASGVARYGTGGNSGQGKGYGDQQQNGNGYGGGDGGAGAPSLSGNSPWAGGAGTSPSADLALWGHLGAGTARWGVEGVAAVLGQTRPIPLGFVAGAVGRLSPAGDMVVEASVTRPRGDSSLVGRVAASWWLPVGVFALKPGASLQGLDPAAQLTAWWVPERGAVWLGGRYGPQGYRTDLQLRATTSWPEPSTVQLWGGARVGRLAGRWLSLGYLADGFDTDTTLDWAHSVTLSLSSPVAP